MIQRDRWGRLTETEWKSPTSVVPTFMCLIDRKGRAQFVREAPIRGLGYAEEHFLGRPFWETSWFGRSGDTREKVDTAVKDALRGEDIECSVDIFDGKGIIIPLTLLVCVLSGHGGDIVGVMSQQRDSGQPKWPDSRMNSFMCLLDKKGRAQFLRQSCLESLGYSAGDILRKCFWDVALFRQSRQSQARVKKGILAALEGRDVECQVDTFDGVGFAAPVLFNICPLKGSEGDIVCVST